MRPLLPRVKAMSSSRETALRTAGEARSRFPGVPSAFAIETDANGSPVTVPEAYWLVCFVPGLKRQWWHRFASRKHSHVFALRMIDEERWLVVEPWWTRLMVSVLTFDEAIKFLHWGAAGSVLRVREAIPGRGSQARGWSNCAVLVSFLLGRAYWTWTPHGLYRRLKAEAATEPIELPQLLSEYAEKTSNNKGAEVRSRTPTATQTPPLMAA
jgi:hypothetical protein